jgi:hypothetical protein
MRPLVRCRRKLTKGGSEAIRVETLTGPQMCSATTSYAQPVCSTTGVYLPETGICKCRLTVGDAHFARLE